MIKPVMHPIIERNARREILLTDRLILKLDRRAEPWYIKCR